MNSSTMKIKRLLGNKNTVTLICAVLGLLVLFFGYHRAVENATQPVEVFYATQNIQPRTLITDAMVDKISVPQAAIDEMGQGNIIMKKEDIVGKKANINSLIPQGSMFYKGAVVDEKDLPDAAVYKLKKGETLYQLAVNMNSSYARAIVPDGYIDIYIRTTDASGKARVGKFVENVKVLAVLTNNSQDAFENTDEIRTPAYIHFAVPDETFIYLTSANQLGLTIFPVPTNVAETEVQPDSSSITSTELKEYIDNLSNKFIQDSVSGEITDNVTDNNSSTQQTTENKENE